MDYNEIKNLLDKYAAGETSPEEEKALHEYFLQDNVHPDFEAWKPLFDYFSAEKNLTTSEGFEEKILAKIKEEKPPVKIFRLYRMKIAVAVLLFIGAAGIIYRSAKKHDNASLQTAVHTQKISNNTIKITDTYDNPEEAKKAVEQALALLSRHLNKGKNIAEKNIGKIDVLNKALDN